MHRFDPRVSISFIQLHESFILTLFGTFAVSTVVLEKASQAMVTARESTWSFMFRKKEYFSNLKNILGPHANEIDDICSTITDDEMVSVGVDDCECHPDLFN